MSAWDHTADVTALRHRDEREQRDRDGAGTDADPDRSVVRAVDLHHRVRRLVASHRRGTMTSTTKRITNGSAGGSPPIHVIVAAYLLTSAAATPTIKPPTNVSGRLVNDPMAAAPNAARTTVVSVAPSSSCRAPA